MTTRVDFLQGADAMAPGLLRAGQTLLEALGNDPRYDVRPIRFRIYSSKLLFPFVYGALPVWLAARRSPLLHITNSWYAHVVPLLRTPAVVTCHDLIQLEDAFDHRTRLKPHRRFHLLAAFRGMLGARLIACDSRAVADRISFYAPRVHHRVRVIPLGLSAQFRAGPVNYKTLRELGVQQPYVLYVGSEQPRKNLERLVVAVSAARRRVPGLQFVKVGSHQTVEGRQSFVQALRQHHMLKDTSILEHVTDDDLVMLYRAATTTTLPSLREGFGFPPLEAMACGCPAIVSNRDSLPETTGGAALVVDPLDTEAISMAIKRLACDDRLRDDLVRRGLERARFFSWSRAAKAYAALYGEALDVP
jgi:glycosyltransferase involved in cell wall biosynthesis